MQRIRGFDPERGLQALSCQNKGLAIAYDWAQYLLFVNLKAFIT